MKKYIIGVISYVFGLMVIVFGVGLLTQDYYYNIYFILIILFCSLISVFPLFMYIEWKNENFLGSAVPTLLGFSPGTLSTRGRIEIRVEKIPKKFAGKTLRYKNYTVYYGVNNNILVTFF